MSAKGIPIEEIALQIVLSIGIIVIAAKYLGLLAKKLNIPQVAGEIVAGLLLRYLFSVILEGSNRMLSTREPINLLNIWQKSELFLLCSPQGWGLI